MLDIFMFEPIRHTTTSYSLLGVNKQTMWWSGIFESIINKRHSEYMNILQQSIIETLKNGNQTFNSTLFVNLKQFQIQILCKGHL